MTGEQAGRWLAGQADRDQRGGFLIFQHVPGDGERRQNRGLSCDPDGAVIPGNVDVYR